ncbi:MAG: hypothetical protein ACRCYY_06500 [Trueperaceae bacterium]
MKCIALFVLASLLLVACSSETTSTLTADATELSGKVENYSGGTGRLDVESGNGFFLETGTISADGTFKITLKNPGSNQVPYMADKTMYNCTNTTFSSNSVRGISAFEIRVEDSQGRFRGYLMQGTSLKALENIFSSKPLDGQLVGRMYSTEDVKVTATGCEADPDKMNFELNLKKGWNFVTAELKNNNLEFFNTKSLEDINWYFVQSMNF